MSGFEGLNEPVEVEPGKGNFAIMRVLVISLEG